MTFALRQWHKPWTSIKVIQNERNRNVINNYTTASQELTARPPTQSPISKREISNSELPVSTTSEHRPHTPC